MSSAAAFGRVEDPPIAWPAWARGAAALLVALSRTAPPLLAFAFVFDPTIAPRLLLGFLIGLGALPAAAAALLARAFAARIVVNDLELRIARADVAIEIPRSSILRSVAWRVPLPGAGVALRLGSGARAPVGIEAPPAALLDALGGAARSHPHLLYAAARRAAPLALARHPIVQLGLFGLVPTAVLFRAHQVIGFGGLFGQYYLEGLGAWATSLALVAASTGIGLVLYGSALRAVAEAIAFGLAWVAPRSVVAVRRAVEWAVAIGYYAGVPAYLALRFLVL